MFATDRRTFLAGSLAAAAVPLRAALPPLFEPKAIAGDLDILAAAYGELHPGLDRYLGRSAFAARIAALKSWAARPRSPGAVFLELGGRPRQCDAVTAIPIRSTNRTRC